MLLHASYILAFLTHSIIYAANNDVERCVIVVKTSQHLSKVYAAHICKKVYSGRLLNISLTEKFQEINVNITMIGEFWINGASSNGQMKCSMMRCYRRTRSRNKTRKKKQNKTMQCKCKGKAKNTLIKNYVCEKDCSRVKITYLTTTSEPTYLTTTSEPLFGKASNTKEPILGKTITNLEPEPLLKKPATTLVPLSTKATTSTSELLSERISASYISSSTEALNTKDTMTIAAGTDSIPYSQHTINNTFVEASAFVTRRSQFYIGVEAKSLGNSIEKEEDISSNARNTKGFSWIGLIAGGATTAVNVLIILALFLCRWRKGRTKIIRRRVPSGESSHSFTFQFTREPTENQTPVRRHTAPVPLIRLPSPYEYAGCIQRSSTPLISEMSSTSRYAFCADDDRKSQSNFSARVQSCASYLSVNDGITRNTVADDYYKLEKLQIPNRRTRSICSTTRRSKSSFDSSNRSRSLSDLSTVVPYAFPLKKRYFSERIAFDIEDQQKFDTPTTDVTIPELFSTSEPHLLNSEVMFQFQLSWETDSESYFMEVETSSFVDNILNKIGESCEQKNS